MEIKLYHQSKDVFPEIHNYWLIQLSKSYCEYFWSLGSERAQEEPGMIMQVIGKAPEEKANNYPHNIIDQSILSILLTTN